MFEPNGSVITPKSVLPKLVWPDQFWQKILPKLVPDHFAAKIGPTRPILAAKTGPPVKCKLATI